MWSEKSFKAKKGQNSIICTIFIVRKMDSPFSLSTIVYIQIDKIEKDEKETDVFIICRVTTLKFESVFTGS